VLELNPFGDLRVAAHTAGRFRDLVVANVALFVPLGIALAWRGTRFVRATTFAVAVSVCAEALQYLAAHGRIAQTTDVITNVAGAAIGWAVFVALTGGWGPLSQSTPDLVSPQPRMRGQSETSSKGRAA
jgi:glycopeptide antibiotics resistance protein